MSEEALRWNIPLGSLPHVINAQRVQQAPGRLVERWRLPRLWTLHLYLYEAELVVNGVTLAIRPGYADLIPPDTDIEYHYRGPAPHLFVHFRLSPSKGKDTVSVPAMQDLGRDFPAVYAAAEDISRWHVRRPRRAGVRLWEILWQLADRTTVATADPDAHTMVYQVCQTIESRLAEPLYVPELARQVALSQRHLSRLFRESLGMTVVDYIRQRRVELARHFLEHSTMPIKRIATNVGIPDLHLFNKVIRRELGKSPRALRG